MPAQQPRSKANLLVAELNALQDGIRRLEEKRLALEDNIIGVIFSPPGGPVVQPPATGLTAFPESLPIRRLSADCPHYFGWNLGSEAPPAEASEESCLPFTDTDGHLIAANTEPSFQYPMADLVAIFHPNLSQEDAVRLVMKLGSVIQARGLHQGSPKLHTGQEIPASLFLQTSVSAQNSTKLKVVASRSRGEEALAAGPPAGKLSEVFDDCLTAIESHFAALAEGAKEPLHDDLRALRAEVDRLATTISKQQSFCSDVKTTSEQFTETIKMLRETESTNVERLDVLQAEAEKFAGFEDSVSLQVRQQQNEVKELRSVIDKVVERLDRQAEVIRNVHKMQVQLTSHLLAL